MNKLKVLRSIIIITILCTACVPKSKVSEQIMIPSVENMPNIPEPYKMRDWKEVAIGYDELVFDFDNNQEFFPVIWIDDAKRNFPKDSFGMYSYVGDYRQGGETYEGIVALGATLSGTLVDIDKSNQNGYNFVDMCENFVNVANGRNIVSNGTNRGDGSFWYSIFPSVPFMGLLDYYENEPGFEELAKINSDRWYEAVVKLGGEQANFEYTYFDFLKMEPVNNDMWYEPDSAAGIGWIQYLSYCKWGDEKYLDATKWCLDYLQGLDPIDNPFYEVLMPYGVYAAVRMNAEQGTDYDIYKFLNWVFDGLAVRPAWGVINEKWGDYDAHGLQGSLTDNGGYAFAMNTFSMAMPLVPLTRYDSRYAKTVGKWMLNAANNARLFYPEELPKESQTCPEYIDVTKNVIAYEGVAKKWGFSSPYAMGDARKQGWAATDFGLYGSSYVGIFGGIISKTNDEKILQLDCLKTDFFNGEAYPTFLYYNPYETAKGVEINVGKDNYDLYDTVSKKFISKNITGKTEFEMQADTAMVIVVVSSEAKIKEKNNKLYADDIIIDYYY